MRGIGIIESNLTWCWWTCKAKQNTCIQNVLHPMSAALTPFGRAFQPLFDRVLAQLDEAARPALRRCAMRSRLGPQRDAAQQEHISKKLKVAPTLAGDKYLGEIREILASKLGLKRSSTQIKFHESFLQAISRILYRSDGAQADMSAIMEREKWSDLQQQVCCLTPRRFGKVNPSYARLVVSSSGKKQ